MFGTYRIERPLGRGGMGTVFLAFDTTLHRRVALKIVDQSGDDTARARVLREARNAAALNHPSICTIHEVGNVSGIAFIAMEYVDGCSLRDRLDSGPMALVDVLRYGKQAADALAHAHERGVVHRDVKAANAMVANERLKLVDFGLARRSDAAIAEATTMPTTAAPGRVAGTPYAMAPEQVRGAEADARTDIWALGILLYEMASGTQPFRAQTQPELFSAILRDDPTPLPSTVPPRLKDVIERCLDKDSDRRTQHAADVAATLAAIESGDVPDRALIPTRPSTVQTVRRSAPVVGVVDTLVAAASQARKWIARWVGVSPRVTSLAVLPLENLSGDPSQDYFADGITEVLSTDLARVSGLTRVTARSSVIRYRGLHTPLDQIARDLRVDALVTGSVQRAGNRVSITAQLLDPSTGEQLWSNRYERSLQDVLSIRNEIVSAIVGEIRATLSAADRVRLASTRTVNPEAFESYLKGRFHWLRQTREDYDQAERYFQLAMKQDSTYAMAYAGLGSVWMMRADAGFEPANGALPIANLFMAKALELDDSLADLHVLLGNQKAAEWDWPGCEREYRRAIEINPNLADAHLFYSDLLLTALSRPDEWSREIQRALELDPLNDFNRSFFGWHLNYVARYDEAIPIFRELLPKGPNKATNYLGLWGAYYRTGMYADALQAARDYFTAAGDAEFVTALGTATASDREAYRAAMTRAGEAMVARSHARHVPAIRIARMFAHANDPDRALQWLERAYDNRESPMSRLRVFWDWSDLHADPRFQNLLERLHLPHK